VFELLSWYSRFEIREIQATVSNHIDMYTAFILGYLQQIRLLKLDIIP